MANSHDGRIDELHGALAAALARGDDEEVRSLLSQIGKAELRAKAPKKRIQPAPMGRAYRIQKRQAHVTVHVSDEVEAVNERSGGKGRARAK